MAELELPTAHLLLLRLNHEGPDEHLFFRDDRYWIDLCMTPRRPEARARYVDQWGPHRFHPMGSVIALPPGFNLHMKHEGGRHISLICSLKAEAVHQWLGSEFEWTDRRLEAVLDISSSEIRALLLRLAEEVRRTGLARQPMCEALVVQLSIELARFLSDVGESTEHGGLAGWRLRIIEKRLAMAGEPPSLLELAKLCDISVRQLTRGFRASRGCSVGDYMAQARIDAAKRRLATEESIKSIATELGFSSQSTFTYAFRRATGVGPSEFRKRILRALEPRLRRI
ncbi:helix-turn-helix transcriptional regulator [Phenylobacterium sp. LjRoot225]|uniref:helix-turn-helix transcriptional regulator n=1 Tax=Phenylobacterium sp. LjRoot225 TaxID=3342285 RepID=UPI003ECDCE76